MGYWLGFFLMSFIGLGQVFFPSLGAREPKAPSFEQVTQVLRHNLQVKFSSEQAVVVAFEQVKGHQYGTLRYGPTFWSFLPFYRCLNNELDECRVEVSFIPIVKVNSETDDPGQIIFLDSYAVNYLSEDEVLAEHLCPLRLMADPVDGSVRVYVAAEAENGELFFHSPQSAVWIERKHRDQELRLRAVLPFNPNPQGFTGSQATVVCHYNIAPRQVHVWTEVFADVQLNHVSGARRAHVSTQELRSSYSPFATIEAAEPRLFLKETALSQGSSAQLRLTPLFQVSE